MFVSVLLGEGRVEMFNLNCQLINFINHLKQRGGVDVGDSVDLMDTNGRLMNLQEKQDSVESAGSLLEERHHYVLLRLRRESTNGKHTLCFYCERASRSFCVLQGEMKQQQQQHCSAFLCWTVPPPATRSSQSC